MKTRSKHSPAAASSGRVSSAGPDAQLHDAREAGVRDVRPCDLGVAGAGLERHEAPPGRQRAGEPDRGVATEGPELEDAPRAVDPRQQLHQPALVRGDRDRRETRGVARLQRGVEHRVLGEEVLADVAVDRGPRLEGHDGEA